MRSEKKVNTDQANNRNASKKFIRNYATNAYMTDRD